MTVGIICFKAVHMLHVSEGLTTSRQAWLLRKVALKRPVPAGTDCHVTEQTSLAANRVISNHVFPQRRCNQW